MSWRAEMWASSQVVSKPQPRMRDWSWMPARANPPVPHPQRLSIEALRLLELFARALGKTKVASSIQAAKPAVEKLPHHGLTFAIETMGFGRKEKLEWSAITAGNGPGPCGFAECRVERSSAPRAFTFPDFNPGDGGIPAPPSGFLPAAPKSRARGWPQSLPC